MSRIIGFAGAAMSGKTTAAEYLEKHHSFEHLNFADPLKKGAAAITGLDEKYFYDQDLKSKTIPGIGYTPRRVLQIIGTDCVREMLSAAFWVNVMQLSIENLHESEDIVIGDVRFEDEAAFIQSYLGGIVIEVVRKDNPTVEHTEHPSEVIDFKCDYVLNNYGNKDELFKKLNNIVVGKVRV